MSDTAGADRSDGNGSYIDWLEENWESFVAPTAPAEEPVTEPTIFVWYPMYMGHFPWPIRTTHLSVQSWMHSMKIVGGVALGVIGLVAAWGAIAWFHNLGQIGFGR